MDMSQKNVIHVSDETITTILDGRYQVIFSFTEFRMSLWAHNISIIDTLHDIVILRKNSHFDVIDLTEINRGISINFRIWPEGGVFYSVDIYPDTRTFFYKDKEYSLDSFMDTFFHPCNEK
ncbi:hypothetical protein [Acinetobacter sp. MD2(2019)]|uniref:hypothetical protein n=1 Tax=Acinetobacter sp. MD2(2019) TaxID=2605273 RepID=UPI002D1E886F|nr:hypothetical protein [Acinetobacter sp. MD2(2019)]MEB3754012.1 hypothetical protein [Acinetobacter sp. MD2(2019)]